MENPTNATKSSSLIDDGSTVVMDDEDFRSTRNSKCPWVMLRDEICGINSSLNLFTHTDKRPKKKRKVDCKCPARTNVTESDTVNNEDVWKVSYLDNPIQKLKEVMKLNEWMDHIFSFF
jgi:hypothetical protein